MRDAVINWLSGKNYHRDGGEGASLKGVLSHLGMPVGLRYHSDVSQKKHFIMSNAASPRILRYLKNREYAMCPPLDIMTLLSTTTVIDNIVQGSQIHWSRTLESIHGVNNKLESFGAFPKHYNGRTFISDGGWTTGMWGKENELTVILFRMHRPKAQKYPYLACGIHRNDIAELKSNPEWVNLDGSWFGTKDKTEFTLFKISRVDSIPIDLTARPQVVALCRRAGR